MAMEAAYKQCWKCRADVFDGACFCMQCGSRLEQQPTRLPSSVRLVIPPLDAKRRPSETGYSLTTPRARRR
jgi:hypothetical protein